MPDAAEEEASCDSFQFRGLWEQICDFLKPQEIEEVRSAIGHAIIEKNEELFSEISSLSEILDEFRERNNILVEERKKKSLIKREMLTSGSDRKLIEQQIKMLLRENSTTPPSSLSANSCENLKVLSYLSSIDPEFILEEEELLNFSWSRPNHQSLPNTGRPTSALSSARASARSCPTDSLTSEFLGNGKCLNANDIKAVVGCLRRGFKKEYDVLVEEIDTLMLMFEDEHKRGNEVEEEIPTTTELRDFSSQLQRAAIQMPVTTMLLPDRPPVRPTSITRKILPSLAPVVSTGLVPPLPLERAAPLGRTSSRLSTKFKSQVADAKETSRDDFHLTDDDGFF